MIIIAGWIELDPDEVEAALEAGRPHIEPVRAWKGCLDYAWTSDLLIPGRIYVYERWENEQALAAHFRGPHYRNMRQAIGAFRMTGADIRKYRIDLAEPVYDEEGVPRADFFTTTGD